MKTKKKTTIKKKTTTKKKTTRKAPVKKKVTRKIKKKVMPKKAAPKKVTKKTSRKKVAIKKSAPKKKVVAKKKVVVKKKRKVNYLNNKDLLIQVHLSKEQDQMTDRLAHMLQTLALRYSKKGNFANYTYNEDMQAYAMMMLVRTWRSFNPEKSQNPFAFFTQCIKNSFLQFLNTEKRQRNIRDAQLVDKGLMPSYNYQLEYETKQKEKKNSDDIVDSQKDEILT